MRLVKWNPVKDLIDFHDEMDSMLDSFFSPRFLDGWVFDRPAVWYPNVDVTETDDEYTLKAELPGMSKDDIQITFKDGVLTLEGERKKETESKDVNYHRLERAYGKFCRSFELPSEVVADKISAEYKDGVLIVHLPKTEESKSKQIKIKVA